MATPKPARNLAGELTRPPRRHLGAGARRAVLVLALAGVASLDAAEVVHRERSLYQTILITEALTRLCLQFSVRRQQRNQSCMDPRQPKRMVFHYTRMMLASLLLAPPPERVLMAGLGGGTLPTALADLLPEAHIDVVEIDPAVVRAAERYFDFTAGERLVVHVQDARVFVKRALADGARYDLVLLDAFTGDYIPEHLTTVEFLREVRSLLAPDGVVAANTFTSSRLYDHESETYRAAFGPFFNLRMPGSGNRIALATRGPLPSQAEMRANAAVWRRPLRPYDVPISDYVPWLSLAIDWNTERRPLSDQYSPANLLRGQSAEADRQPP